jgi:hypothetical protein
VVAMMMARAGGCLGHATRDQNSCGDHSSHHTRPDQKPPRRLLRVQHIVKSPEKYCRPCDK